MLGVAGICCMCIISMSTIRRYDGRWRGASVPSCVVLCVSVTVTQLLLLLLQLEYIH